MNSISHVSSTNNIVHTEHIDVKKLWDDALVNIELSISPANFKTWFRDTHIVSLEDGTVSLGVPSVFRITSYNVCYTKLLRVTPN